MPTLTGSTFSGFTRPADPIDATQLATKISTDIGKTVLAVVTSTDVLITGGTLVSGDGTGIQNSMNTYFYIGLQYGAAMYADDDGTMAADSGVHIPTQRAVVNYLGANSDHIRTGGGLISGAIPYLLKGVTNASGIATLYITGDGTSTGTAVFSTVYEDGILAMPIGATSNYQVLGIVLSGDKKSIAVSVNQLGSVILGLVNVTSAAAGVEVRAVVVGK